MPKPNRVGSVIAEYTPKLIALAKERTKGILRDLHLMNYNLVLLASSCYLQGATDMAETIS